MSLSQDNKNIINSKTISKIKKDAIIINTSRGDCINEEDLINALDKKNIAGAGLDVFKNEPYKGKLSGYKNVILTPHIGSYSREIRLKMEIEAVNNLIFNL